MPKKNSQFPEVDAVISKFKKEVLGRASFNTLVARAVKSMLTDEVNLRILQECENPKLFSEKTKKVVADEKKQILPQMNVRQKMLYLLTYLMKQFDAMSLCAGDENWDEDMTLYSDDFMWNTMNKIAAKNKIKMPKKTLATLWNSVCEWQSEFADKWDAADEAYMKSIPGVFINMPGYTMDGMACWECRNYLQLDRDFVLNKCPDRPENCDATHAAIMAVRPYNIKEKINLAHRVEIVSWGENPDALHRFWDAIIQWCEPVH
ncbi:MAG: hypothetical protein FWF34_01540 [Alphaproteobacteria bacterium]|nr:hypothetical protein [Alphaproteobacteria bacterium]MCL2889921.1 hypothetical protein [Alphaproteobacteria bacterium]